MGRVKRTDSAGGAGSNGWFEVVNYLEPPTHQGQTVRLVFTWHNDHSYGAPPVAFDDVRVVLSGPTSRETKTIPKGTSLGDRLPAPVADVGLHFVGWFIGEEEFTADTIVNEDITVTARIV